MNPTPVRSMHCATCGGVRARFTPSASSTSALPDLLETERPPCLATFAPAAAATNAAAVDMLNVCAPSPPVPQVSRRYAWSATCTLVENSRITCAAAAISPMVSFFTRKPMIIAEISVGDISPFMIWRISASISSWNISRCSMTLTNASCGVICNPEELLKLSQPNAKRAALTAEDAEERQEEKHLKVRTSSWQRHYHRENRRQRITNTYV